MLGEALQQGDQMIPTIVTGEGVDLIDEHEAHVGKGAALLVQAT